MADFTCTSLPPTEVSQWLDFVAECFATKVTGQTIPALLSKVAYAMPANLAPQAWLSLTLSSWLQGTPRSYFQRHIEQDPSFAPSQVVVRVADPRASEQLPYVR